MNMFHRRYGKKNQPVPQGFSVLYDKGMSLATGGVPIDSVSYPYDGTGVATILPNSGGLGVSGGQFIGWSKTKFNSIIGDPNNYPSDLMVSGNTIQVISDIVLYAVYTVADGLYVRTYADGVYHPYIEYQGTSIQYNMTVGDIIVIVKDGEHFGLNTYGHRFPISDTTAAITDPTPNCWSESEFNDIDYTESVNRTYTGFTAFCYMIEADAVGRTIAVPSNNAGDSKFTTPTTAWDDAYWGFILDSYNTANALYQDIFEVIYGINENRLIGEDWHILSKTEMNDIILSNSTITNQLKDTYTNYLNGSSNYYTQSGSNLAWIINSTSNVGSGQGSKNCRRWSWAQNRYCGNYVDDTGKNYLTLADDQPLSVYISKIHKDTDFYVGISCPSLRAANAAPIFYSSGVPSYSTVTKGGSYTLPSFSADNGINNKAWNGPSSSAPAGLEYPSGSNPVQIIGTGFLKFVGFIDSRIYKPNAGNKIIFTTQAQYDGMKSNILHTGDVITNIKSCLVFIPVFALKTLTD